MTIIVLHNQSLIDIALQVTGRAENALQMAKDNSLELTDELEAGAILSLPLSKGKGTDTDIVNYYKANHIKPACGLSITDKQKAEGISVWAIGVDFVSQP